MASLVIVFLSFFGLISCYDLTFSNDYMYYDGGSRSPRAINLRTNTNVQSSLLICWEEIRNTEFSGLCEIGSLDNNNNNIIFNNKEVFADTNGADPYEIQIYDNGWTNYFLLGYTNAATSSNGPGRMLLGEYNPSDNSIRYSIDTFTFNPSENDQTNILELQNNSYFIVCSSVGPLDQYNILCRIGQYNLISFSIQFGPKTYNMTNNHVTHGMGLTRINSYQFLACFSIFVERRGVCYVGTVRNKFDDGLESDIVYGNQIVLSDDIGIDNINIIHANQTTLIICYLKRNGGECKLGTVQYFLNGDATVIIPSQAFVYQSNEINEPSIFRVPPNVLLPSQNNPELLGICYVNDRNGVCKFGEVDLDNMVINFDNQETNTFNDQSTGRITTLYLRESLNKMIVCYIRYSGSTPLFNRGVCKYGTISQ